MKRSRINKPKTTLSFVLMMLALFCSVSSKAQKKELELADVYFEYFMFDEAATNYEAALNKMKTPDPYAMRQLAKSYQYNFKYNQAEAAFAKLIAQASGLEDEDYLEYGIILKLNGKYEPAREMFLKYKSLKNNSDPFANSQLSSLEWAVKTADMSIPVQVTATNLDMSGQCLGFSLTSNGVIYSHSRNNKKIGPIAMFDLDFAEKIDTINFNSKPGLLDAVNMPGNEGGPSLNNNSKLLYFYANASKVKNTGGKKINGVEIGKDGASNFKIYVTEFIESASGRIEELPFNKSTFNCIHPSISDDGEVLYFASDMPGGQGGLDLYLVRRNSTGGWGEPINLGTSVNTPANEMFPFISKGRLYFSSKGFNGYGGYDIYTSKLAENGMPSTPQNMGKPYNSFRDDVSFICYDNGRFGYFASNRDNNDGMDKMYYFHDYTIIVDSVKTAPPPVAADTLPKEKPVEVAVVTPPPAPVSIEPVKPTVEKPVEVLADEVVKATAKPKAVKPTKPAPAPKPKRHKAEPKEVNEPDAPEPVQSVSDDELVAKHFEPVKFRINDFKVDGDYHIVLDSVVRNSKRSKTIHIQIYGFADSRGDAEYNLNLSLRRANHVKKYLISKGFPSNRIIVAGFGETRLLNQCADGIECTEEQHAVNRRVEVQFVR